MSHWQVLGLTPDADERSIKRAYARLLKIHRPDENPNEFQRLREAYEASLAEARWRAQAGGKVVYAPSALSASPAERYPPAEDPTLVILRERVDIPTTVSPPEPSLSQMQQWLAEGKDRQVMDALRLWLASDWLLSFERRQQFEQSILDWLESAEGWSPTFFDGVCQVMGWDETQGNLPCEYGRWDRLIRRCEAHALAETVLSDLARFDDDKMHGQAAAMLFKPMTDRRRREMADGFSGLDWQRFAELAQAIEYQYPELPQRLGLQPLDNWREWLPPTSYGRVYLFLWVALSAVLIVSVFFGPMKKDGVGVLLLMPLMMMFVNWIGMKAYHVWARVAVVAGRLDVLISRLLLPRRWYRQGAGLLLLRHVLPSAVPAALACAWSSDVLWLRWVSPVVVFLGTIYFTNDALSGGKASMWARALRALRLRVGQLPWHLLKREGLLAVIAVAVMAATVYFRMSAVV
ncbi:J domain-containing protein [Pseudomonas halotolerans]|uniref:J domain-containing protein n=1 Tax=Pseudomonas halotolerans TaxID=3143552 RepID=UPI0031D94AAD